MQQDKKASFLQAVRGSWACFAWVFGHFAVTIIATLLAHQADQVLPVWPANAMAAAALLQVRMSWPRVGGFLASSLVGGWIGGNPLDQTVLVTLSQTVEVAIAVMFLRRAGGIEAFLSGLRPYLTFAFLATAVPSFAGAVVGTVLLPRDGAPVTALTGWFMASWLGYLLTLPLIGTIKAKGAELWRPLARSILPLILTGTTAAIVFVLRAPGPFMTGPAALLAMATGGTLGAVLACWTTAFVAVPAILRGAQPLLLGLELNERMVVFQLYLAVLSLLMLGASAMLEQWRRMDRARNEMVRREREARDRLEIVQRGADLGTWVHDIPAARLQFNQRALDLLGLTAEQGAQMSREHYEGLIHPDDRLNAMTAVRDHVLGRAADIDLEVRVRHHQGHFLWILMRGRVVDWDTTGRPTLLAGTHMDVTAVKEARAKAEAAEQMLRAGVECIDDGFLVVNASGQITLWNQHFRDLHPELQTLPDLKGLTFADLLRHWVKAGVVAEPSDDAGMSTWIAEKLAARETQIGQQQVHRYSNGRWVRTAIRRMPDGGNVTTFTDVTELKLREEELAIERTRAEEASRHKSEFLAAMSHELRTPLNGVIGFNDLLLGTPLSEEQRRYVEMQRDAGELLLAVISDILDYSKAEAGKIELDPQPFNPAELVREAVAMIRGAAEAKGLVLEATTDASLPGTLHGDAVRIRQVLLNLLNNALKFTPAGRIAISARALPAPPQQNARIRFEVSDTGIGIAEDQQPRLFQEFMQVDRSTTRRYGGTGLGLAICRRLVTLMEGEIGVRSVFGTGSTFWFEVPLPAVAAALPPPAPDPQSGPHIGARILVVEDEPTNRLIATTILGNAGYLVAEAENGEQALAHVAAEKVDLVIMDIRMPVTDGLAATRRLRALEGPLSRLPVIGLTAQAGADEIEAARQAGMDEVMTKPFNAQRLLKAVDRALGRTQPASPRPALRQAV